MWHHLLAEIPFFSENPWIYYTICGVVFTTAGITCGYFIWRKGHSQTAEVESEVKETEKALKLLRDEVLVEERALPPLDDLASEEIEAMTSDIEGERPGKETE
ncbi:MAG: hypothetical protein AAF236_10955 [Verrucomicrobiota bacterium]